MTDKETNAAEAWLILNDADAVEKKVLDVLGKAFSDSNADGMNNREMFMSAMTRTETMRGYVTSLTMGDRHQVQTNDIIKRILESAEVVIQDSITTYKPQIAVRFHSPYGGSFVVYPKVSRV